ncbi:MAG: hypothetical protein RLN59_01750 [Haliea sp.]|uniref:hypothetical protein n=1 Tax=Alloalcanivorax xenomutans TaxID=1094342 RepID=UPI0011C0675F
MKKRQNHDSEGSQSDHGGIITTATKAIAAAAPDNGFTHTGAGGFRGAILTTPSTQLSTRMPSKTRQFHTRIDAELLDRFQRACTSRNTPTSEVVRAFMRDYVARWEEEIRRGQTDHELLQRIAHLEAQLHQAGIDVEGSDRQEAESGC